MPYIATIEILIDVETKTDAMDAVAETLRDHMRPYAPQSCFRDWKWAEDIRRSNIERCVDIPADFEMDAEWPDVLED